MARSASTPDLESLRGGQEILDRHTMFEKSHVPTTAVHAAFSHPEDPTAIGVPPTAEIIPIEQLRAARAARALGYGDLGRRFI